MSDLIERLRNQLGFVSGDVNEAADRLEADAATIERLTAEHGTACKLVADMHAAAMGGVILGPIRGVVEDIADLRAERDRLTAEVAARREYAERYLWLRDKAPSSTWRHPVVCEGSRDLGDAQTFLGGDTLDAAIDAARTASTVEATAKENDHG